MQVLDRTGVGTLWSICKTKFALAGHTHSWSQISGAPATATKLYTQIDQHTYITR